MLSFVGIGCGNDGSGAGGEITVFAAASLTDSFDALGTAFAASNPGAEVTFNFGASSDLVTQITEGARADVFAAADLASMARLVDGADQAAEPTVFATNAAEIVVAPGNPRGITGVADLADPGLIAVACAPAVPCGRYTLQVLDNAGVSVEFKSLEENVRAVVSKVTLGEADAGIVYSTDVLAAGDDADGVAIPSDINVTAEYPIVVTERSAESEAALAFVDFVLSEEGQAILESFGFGPP
jgi:molybdate transport system substrate-binding protein